MISPMLYILLSVDGLEMSILMTPFTHGRYPHSTNLPSWGSRAIEPSSSLRLIGESISRTTPSFRARRLSQRFLLSCCDLVMCLFFCSFLSGSVVSSFFLAIFHHTHRLSPDPGGYDPHPLQEPRRRRCYQYNASLF